MLQISKLLKKHQLSDIKASDSIGNTILHLTVVNEELTPQEKIQILDISLNKDIDPNAENRNKETALKLAIASRAKDIIDFFITRNVHIDDSTACYVVKNEYIQFQQLLENVSEISDTEIQIEESESRSFVKWLISKKLLNIDYQYYQEQTALIMAIRYNLQHILPTLLKYTNDINYIEPRTKSTLLHEYLESNASLHNFAWFSAVTLNKDNNKQLQAEYIRRYASDIVKTMLDRGVSPDAVDIDGNTALHIAIAKKENIAIIEMLIKRTMNLNHKNLQGQTPFYLAILKWAREPQSEDYMTITRALIAKGADVNQGDQYGTSPLYILIKMYNIEAVKLLIENKANSKVSTSNGETLLHLFVKSCSRVITVDDEKIKIFDMLINNGCEINARDERGDTALHIAVRRGNIVITQKLVENWAQPNCKNNQGETPLCCLDYIYDQNEYTNGGNTNLLRLPPEHDINAMIAQAMQHLVRIGPSIGNKINIYDKTMNILLRYGADFNERVLNGYSILRIALWRLCHKRFYGLDISPEGIYSLKDVLSNYNCYKINLLLIHWIRLEIANLKCDTTFKYSDLVKIKQYEMIENKCIEEIEKLKDTSIDSQTSLYTLLHMNLNRRRAYINNEKLQKLLESPKLEEEFPEYSALIFAGYKEAIRRKSLMHPAKRTWLELTQIKLPEVCIELIFSFLSNAELFNFIEGI